MSDDLLPCPFCGTTPNQSKDGVYIIVACRPRAPAEAEAQAAIARQRQEAGQ